MRGIIVCSFLVLFCIFFIPVHIVFWLIGRKNPTKRYDLGFRLIRWAFGVELKLAGCDLTVYGKENIPEDTCLFVSNHRSYFDILVTHNAIDRPVGYVAKVEMAKYPLLNHYMRDIGCIFLDREDVKAGFKTMLQGVELLKMGHSMLICPEGTRNQNDGVNTFKEGSLKMAEKAKVPVVPVALIGTDDLLEKNKGFRFTAAKVKIVFGKPFYMQDLPAESKKKSGAYVQKIVEDMIAEYKNKE